MDKLEKEIADSVKNMNFGDAIKALKAGLVVCRAGWNGKGMFLLYIESDFFEIPDLNISILPWIGIKTADNKFVPWLASQTDVLAEDWQVID